MDIKQNKQNRGKKSKSGSVLVESIFVIIFLLMVLSSLAEIGYRILSIYQLSVTARDASRLLSVSPQAPENFDKVKSYVDTQLQQYPWLYNFQKVGADGLTIYKVTNPPPTQVINLKTRPINPADPTTARECARAIWVKIVVPTRYSALSLFGAAPPILERRFALRFSYQPLCD